MVRPGLSHWLLCTEYVATAIVMRSFHTDSRISVAGQVIMTCIYAATSPLGDMGIHSSHSDRQYGSPHMAPGETTK